MKKNFFVENLCLFFSSSFFSEEQWFVAWRYPIISRTVWDREKFLTKILYIPQMSVSVAKFLPYFTDALRSFGESSDSVNTCWWCFKRAKRVSETKKKSCNCDIWYIFITSCCTSQHYGEEQVLRKSWTLSTCEIFAILKWPWCSSVGINLEENNVSISGIQCAPLGGCRIRDQRSSTVREGCNFEAN